MQIIGKAKKVTIYIGESDKWKRKPLHIAILEMLKAENCAGATVTRALAGFGAHSQIHTASVVALSADLPLIVEWVDNPARVDRVMPRVQEMVTEGLITVQDVDVTFYSHRGLRHLSAFVPVQDVMSRNVHTVSPNTPLAEAVKLLVDRVSKTLPVVDEQGRVVGIFTDGDLLNRVSVLATSATAHLTRAELHAELQHLRSTDQTVQDVMTPNPITITADATIPQAVALLLEHDIKRLPVVDSGGKLVGLVSRVDILKAFSAPLTAEAPRPALLPGRHATVEEVMMTQIPTVRANAPLGEVVGLLVSSVQRRAVVVDDDRCVVGIVSDGDLVKRATPTERSGIVQSLSRRLSPERPEQYGLNRRTAAEVMTTPVITVTPDTRLIDALQILLEQRIKRLPVVDADGRLIGLVGRGGILQALGQTVANSE